MTESELDPRRLRQLMAPAVDAVCAHRMACGRAPDLEQITAIREALEDHVVQALQQVDVRAQGQVDVELAAAQFEAHDQFRHGLHRQRIEGAQAETFGIEPGGFTGLADHLLGVLD